MAAPKLCDCTACQIKRALESQEQGQVVMLPQGCEVRRKRKGWPEIIGRCIGITLCSILIGAWIGLLAFVATWTFRSLSSFVTGA